MSTIDRRTTATVAPLMAGQRLDREEFHRRYEAMPPHIRAELIGGVVVMSSPVGPAHAENSANVVTWINLYRRRTPGVSVGDNASAALDDIGEPQPDALLRILPECGGQTRTERRIIVGAPELVVEVADTSRALDLGAKRDDYERAGVLEYVVATWGPEDVHWHVRRGDRLVRVPPGPDGLYRSEVFPGLWLDPAALLGDDLDGLIAALDRGLATAAHAAFIARLAAARGTPPRP
jgi:Uma2 family endonuclease